MENQNDQTLNQESNQNETQKDLLTFWNELTFDGKHLCKIEEGFNLVLKATSNFADRPLSTINEANAQAVITALTDKFLEVEQKHNEFVEDYNNTQELFKQQGKLQRQKSYLLNTNAIGNFDKMFDFINEKETIIKTQLKANEQIRKAIVEKAVTLKNAEDYKNTTEAFKLLVEEWKQAPYIEKELSDKFWTEIEAARNFFYERKRTFQEGLEKEFMQNLDLKLELCEQAEKLSQSESWKETSEKYKQLMEQWKGIGRVATQEKNDELWNRFINAKNAFFEKKTIHQNQILEEQEANYLAKVKLVELAESIKENTNWKETAAQYAQILEDWKAIGKVPYEKSDEIWSRMQLAKDFFFDAKRQQAESYKVNLEDNYAQKKALVERIETIKKSFDWRETTQEINELLATWKTIGPVPREYGDSLWEQFIGARQFFFKRKDEDRDARKNKFLSQTQSRIQQSKIFLATIEEELADDESKLIEFNDILANTKDEDAKDKEIKQNLAKLVEQIERKLPIRKAKIEEVKNQIIELEQKLADNNTDKNNKTES